MISRDLLTHCNANNSGTFSSKKIDIFFRDHQKCNYCSLSIWIMYFTLVPMITGAQCPISLWHQFVTFDNDTIYTDSKVDGANMGPTWVLSAPGGPHIDPINLAIRDDEAWRRPGELGHQCLRSGLSPVQRQAITWTYYIYTLSLATVPLASVWR